jgi:large subunit ribosomal protein L21
MYSIIESGGLQYKVTLGETLKVPRIEAEVGTEVTIPKVLLVANGEEIQVGTPHLPETGVTVEILSHDKDEKIRIFKKKRRKGYRKTQGHRQPFTQILVKEFVSGSEKEKADKKVVDRQRARVSALARLKMEAANPPKKKPVKQEEKTQEE